jgi:hypothetical protein
MCLLHREGVKVSLGQTQCSQGGVLFERPTVEMRTLRRLHDTLQKLNEVLLNSSADSCR